MTPSSALHQSIRWMMLDAMMSATWQWGAFDARAGLYTFRGHGGGWTFHAVVHSEWQFGHARRHELLVELGDYEALLGATWAGYVHPALRRLVRFR